MRAGLYLSIGVLLGALVMALLLLRGAVTLEEAAILGLPLGLVYAAVCLAARYPCHAAPLGRTSVTQIATTHATAAAISAVGWVVIGRVLARVLQTLPGFAGLEARFKSETPTLLITGVLVFLLAVAVHYLVIALESARDAEVRGVEARVLAREAELRALRAQVDPHFLFNSLNSIAALTSEDAAAARRMCLLLAGFMRRSLVLGSRERIPLADELALVSDYLAIEKVRFGARLSVAQTVDDAVRDCAVPPLLLQPLVENAVRHGIAQVLEGGTVRLDLRRAGERVLITVENPRDHERPAGRGAGVGLDNVRGRLRSLYGGDARLDVEMPGDLFRVTLSLPAQPAAAAPPAVPGATATPAVPGAKETNRDTSA